MGGIQIPSPSPANLVSGGELDESFVTVEGIALFEKTWSFPNYPAEDSGSDR